MYDNISIKFEDAEQIINYFNASGIIRKLKKRIKQGENTAQNYAFISNAYMEMFENKKALKFALKSIRLDKKYAYAYYLAGILYLEEENYEKALDYLQKSYKFGGEDYYFAIYGLVHYYEEKDECGCYGFAKKMVDLNYDYPDFLIFRAATKFMYSFDLKDCIKDIFSALKNTIKYKYYFGILVCLFSLLYVIIVRFVLNIFTPKDLRYEKLRYYVLSGQDKQAYDMYKKLGEDNPKKKDTYYREILDIYFWKEDYEKCIVLANKFLVEFKSAYIWMYKARSYDCLGKLDKAIKSIDKAREYDNEFKEHQYYYWKAKFHYNAGKYSDALKYINEQIIFDDVPDVTNYMFKAKCYYVMNNNAEAITWYLSAFQIDNGDNRDEICWWLAYLYHSLGDLNKAIVYIDIALMENKDSYNYTLKGDILTSMKNVKEANECYKKASKCNAWNCYPPHPRTCKNLEHVL